MRRAAFLCGFFLFFTAMSVAAPPERIPIILDTDIGTDVDDAFALALILRSPELDLLAVTTVAGDTQARARLAAKMLWEAGRPKFSSPCGFRKDGGHGRHTGAAVTGLTLARVTRITGTQAGKGSEKSRKG